MLSLPYGQPQIALYRPVVEQPEIALYRPVVEQPEIALYRPAGVYYGNDQLKTLSLQTL